MFISASLIFLLLACKLSLYTRDVQQGKTDERQAYSILVDDRFKKQGNLRGLSWRLQADKISASTCQKHKSLYGGLKGFQHICHSDGLNTTSLSQGCVLGTVSSMGRISSTHRTGEAVKVWLPGSSSRINRWSGPLNDLLRTCPDPIMANMWRLM